MSRGAAGPEVVVLADAGRAAAEVARRLGALVRSSPGAVIGLAAGNTPRPVHAAFVADARRHHLPLGGLHLTGLDEYAGLAGEHPAAFRAQFRRELVDPLGLDPDRLHTLDGTATDPVAECAAFERRLQQLGGVTWQLLGIGRNGHIGFNEPGTPFDARTRVVELSATTRADNAAAFGPGGVVPQRALTQGIATILEAGELVLLATGAAKADAVAAAVRGPADERVPASALHLHAHATFVLDREAARALA